MPGLVYPGTRAAFNPTHPAASGQGVSAVALGNTFLRLDRTALASILAGSPAAKTLGVIGPGVSFPAGSADITLGGVGGNGSNSGLFAAIVQFQAVAGSYQTIFTNGDAIFGLNASGHFNLYRSGDNDSGIAAVANVPYFVSVVHTGAGGTATTAFVVTNLATGQISTGIATAGNLFTSGTSLEIGANSGVQQCQGTIAAVMFEPVVLSKPPQLQWAQDPWPFWYPQKSRPIYLFSPPAAAVLQAEPHFIGRMTAQPIFSMAALRQNQASDQSGPLGLQAETNTHFVGKFQPPKMSVLQGLRQNSALDVPVVVITDDPPGLIGRFLAPSMRVLRSLRENTANDTSSSITQPETNTHFVGRFASPVNWLLRSLRENQASDASSLALQPSTNVHFIGKFAATAINLLPWLRQNTANDLSTATLQAETNTHFIGRFTKIPMILPLSSRQNQANDFFAAAPFDNPTHFVGKFTPPMVAVLRSLRENTANDSSTPVPQADTATHFISRFVQTPMLMFLGSRQNQATDISTAVKQIFDWLVTARRRGRR